MSHKYIHYSQGEVHAHFLSQAHFLGVTAILESTEFWERESLHWTRSPSVLLPLSVSLPIELEQFPIMTRFQGRQTEVNIKAIREVQYAQQEGRDERRDFALLFQFLEEFCLPFRVQLSSFFLYTPLFLPFTK